MFGRRTAFLSVFKSRTCVLTTPIKRTLCVVPQSQNTNQKHEELKQESTEKRKKERENSSWWSSLPLKKKFIYGSCFTASVSLLTLQIYESFLKSSVPYQISIHTLKVDGEIQDIFGNVTEPKWYKDVLWGNIADKQNQTVHGVATLRFPISGDKGEHGIVHVEAEKYGAGPLQWQLTFMVVTLDNGKEIFFIDRRVQRDVE